MESLFAPLPLFIWLDDFLGFDRTAEALLENLCQALNICLQSGLKLNSRKCKLFKKKKQTSVDASLIQKTFVLTHGAMRHSPSCLPNDGWLSHDARARRQLDANCNYMLCRTYCTPPGPFGA